MYKHCLHILRCLQESEEAKRLYDGIRQEYDVDDSAGLALLLSACECLDFIRQAEAEIKKHGLVITDKYSRVKSNPACTVLKEHKTLMLNYLKALNLDFSSIDKHAISLNNLN